MKKPREETKLTMKKPPRNPRDLGSGVGSLLVEIISKRGGSEKTRGNSFSRIAWHFLVISDYPR